MILTSDLCIRTKTRIMNTKNICVFAKWKVKDDALEYVLPLMETLIEESKKEPGNLGYHICQLQSDSNSFYLFERYEDKTALEAHKESQHFKELVLQKIAPHLKEREVFISNEIFFNQIL